MRLIIFLFSFCSIFLFIMCHSEKEVNFFSGEVVRQYGKLEGNQNEIFGLINCFAINYKEDLYIVDRAFQSIKIYSPAGVFLKRINLLSGNGPGEFMDIQDIDVDSSGNIYFIDKISRRINILDSTGTYVSSLKVPMMPAQIVVPQRLNVFVAGFPHSYEGPLIYNYNFNTPDLEQPSNVFCERIKDQKLTLDFTGNSGRLSKNNKGDILYSFFYPYETRIYSAEGVLKRTYKREVAFYKEPYFDSEKKYVVSPNGNRGLLVFDNHIANLIYQETGNNVLKFYLDYWDSESNSYVGMIDAEKCKIENLRYIKTDSNNNIYYDIFSPYPRIIKIRIRNLK